MFFHADDYEDYDGAGFCPECLDEMMQWVDTDEPEGARHCPACGYSDVWVEPDVPFEIILPKYEG